MADMVHPPLNPKPHLTRPEADACDGRELSEQLTCTRIPYTLVPFTRKHYTLNPRTFLISWWQGCSVVPNARGAPGSI